MRDSFHRGPDPEGLTRLITRKEEQQKGSSRRPRKGVEKKFCGVCLFFVFFFVFFFLSEGTPRARRVSAVPLLSHKRVQWSERDL